jgi:hypothetical protein
LRGATLWGLVGIPAFWVPCMVIHWFAGSRFNGRYILAECVAAPVTLVVVLYVAWLRLLVQRIHPLAVWAAMTIGFWFAGPCTMAATDVVMGSPVVVMAALAGGTTVIFPFGTFMMATYHGELGPLILAPMLLLIAVTPLADRWRVVRRQAQPTPDYALS